MIKKIISKLILYKQYILANTLFRKTVDSGNNCFNIMTDKELVDKIVEGYSFSRFGDGELSLIYNKNFNISFQKNNKFLNERLEEVLNSKLDNLIIGISIGFNDPSEYNKAAQRHYRAFNYTYREKFKKIIPKNKVYGNTSITRFYMDYDTSDKESTLKRLKNLQRIWEGRKILIVEGEKTRSGVGNDLFSNAKRIRRIIVPSVNAFDKYDTILKTVLKKVEKNELILMSIGPTATVLAYDLAKNGQQGVDIGHTDIEYEWMRMNAKKRVRVPGKYTNEVKGNKFSEAEHLEREYKDSIVEVV